MQKVNPDRSLTTTRAWDRLQVGATNRYNKVTNSVDTWQAQLVVGPSIN